MASQQQPQQPLARTNPSKRPRLSLQISTAVSQPFSRSARGFPGNPNDPTAFNTLSNTYATVVERSTPIQSEPLTAINTLQAFSLVTPIEHQDLKQRVVTPYVASYPETPLTAGTSPSRMEINYPSTMTATPPLSAGPVSATEGKGKVFSFSAADTAGGPVRLNQLTSPVESRSPWRRAAPPLPLHRASIHPPPYSHPRSLQSILRNSPLPPRTAIPPPSPRRQSVRLQERAARRVEYDSPLEREITTTLYTRSHIDLLAEEASPMSGSPLTNPEMGEPMAIDLASAFTANELQDGGQTPGPFDGQDVQRRMAALAPGTPTTPSTSVSSPSSGPWSAGIRKRRRKDKKRRWVWRFGDDDEDGVGEGSKTELSGATVVAAVTAQTVPLIAIPRPVPRTPVLVLPSPRQQEQQSRERSAEDEAKTPIGILPLQTEPSEVLTPSIEKADSTTSGSIDVEMSDDACSIVSEESYLTASEPDLDLKTPIAPKKPGLPAARLSVPLSDRDTPIPDQAGPQRDTPIPEWEGKTRDTPIPELSKETRDTPIPELSKEMRDTSVPLVAGT